MKTIEEVIKSSLEELLRVWKNNGGKKSRLIFPKYRLDGIRVSEQEARFVFTRELENQTEYYYSVETPTKIVCKFSENGKKIPPKIVSVGDNGGKSARVDVCIYDGNENRIHLIEFKAHNVNKDSVLKDFIKLRYENDEKELTNYFVHLLEKHDNGTINSLIGKYDTIFKFRDAAYENSNPVKNKKVVVCFCFLKESQILFVDECNMNEKLSGLKK
jgi:hypothetical protein